MMKFVYMIIVHFFVSTICAAAVLQERLPLAVIPKKVVNPIDYETVFEEDSYREEVGLPLLFAIPTVVSITPVTHGIWERLPNNKMRWSFRVLCDNALSINLGFGRYKMPQSGSMTILDVSREFHIRPFTNEDNKDHGELWTPIVPSNQAVIEIVVDRSDKQMVSRNIELTAINVGYRGFNDDNRGSSGACNIDVVCSQGDDWWNEIPSVGMYTLNGIGVCSGAMINNTAEDQTPYFLTANHCGVTSSTDSTIVVYWNYQNSYCRIPGSSDSGGNGNGSFSQFTSGSTMRATRDYTDFTLTELSSVPNANWGITWSGWSRSSSANGVGVGIHHPDVCEKRISIPDYSTASGEHWDVNWAEGTTEPGSSGSPLYNSNHRIVGQLCCGAAACGNDANDSYGRSIELSWSGSSSSSLNSWLDPLGVNVMYLDTLYPVSSGPTIDYLEATPAVVYFGETVHLEAYGVSPANSEVLRVDFYRDTDNSCTLTSSDLFLGTDWGPSNWDWNEFVIESWGLGLESFIAVATDVDGIVGEAVCATLVVEEEGSSGDCSYALGVNPGEGDPIPENGSGVTYFFGGAPLDDSYTITRVEYNVKVTHEQVSDVIILLGSNPSIYLWLNDGCDTDCNQDDDSQDDYDIELNWRVSHAWDGQPANKSWSFWFLDSEYNGLTGEVVTAHVKIYYEAEGAPDVVVTSVWTEPATPIAGEECVLKVEFQNQGSGTAYDIDVDYYINGEDVGSDSHDELDPGESRTESKSYTFTSEGNYSYLACAKIDACKGDSNTSNDCDSTSVQVDNPILTGACCTWGFCSQESADDCMSKGGNYFGDKTLCDTDICILYVCPSGCEFNSIQDAVDVAMDGDEIIVLPGTYTSTTTEVVNMLGKEVTLRSNDPSNPDIVAATIINGEGDRRGIVCVNSETTKTTIKGFTIANGYAGANSEGGGMYNINSSPTLTSCVFMGNTGRRGGGMYNTNSSPTLTNCTFTNNKSIFEGGGGMFNQAFSSPTLNNCIFTNNIILLEEGSLAIGGGMVNNWYCSPILNNCMFAGNTASRGGGMGNSDGCQPTLTNCTFSDNYADYDAGGIYNEDESNPILLNTIVCGNTPDQIYGSWTNGGGTCIAYSCEDSDLDGWPDKCTNSGGNILLVPEQYAMIQDAINVAVHGDEIVIDPGTYTGDGDWVINPMGKQLWIHSSDGPEVTIIDGEGVRLVIQCAGGETSKTIIEGLTITRGYSGSSPNNTGGGINNSGSSPTLNNCIFTDNTATWGGGMYNYESSPMLTDCTFTNNSALAGGGTYNEHSSPTLTNCTFTNNTASNNYGGGGIYNEHDSSTLINTTVCGNTPDQIYGDWTDNGGNWVEDECPIDCTSDINVDGNVDVNDLLILIADWGTCTDNCVGDVNGDGTVNVNDLLLLIAAWGPCP